MNKTLGLGYGILKKEVLVLARYRVNTASYFVMLYAIFLMIYLGGQMFGGEAFDDSLGGIIVAYFLVTMSFTAFSQLANTFSREAAWGTLEQLYMTEVGFRRAALLIALVQIFLGFVWGIAMLVLMLLTTGATVSIDLLSVTVIVLLSIMPVVGLGFVMGGAAVLYKRIDNLFSLMQFAFYGLVAVPVQTYPVLKLLPLAQGSYLLRLVMDQGYRLTELPLEELGILAFTGVGYAVVGYVIFERIVAIARDRGVMGHY